MSTSLEVVNGVTDPSQSPKKRKHEEQGKKSSKKRKQNVEETEETSVTQQLEMKAEKKRGKDKKKTQLNEKILEPATSQEEDRDVSNASRDIEFHDAPSIDVVDAELDEATGLLPSFVETINPNQIQSPDPTSFHSVRISLYLPISPVSLTTSSSSILAEHLAPLLLTYFAPAEGIILSYSDPILSARPEAGLNLPLLPPKKGKIPKHPPNETFSRVGDEFGACWVWLTATFLVFRPQPGNELTGWTNVTSEGFVGLLSYNYFQTSVAKSRIPKAWTWTGAYRGKVHSRKKSKKGKLNDDVTFSQQETLVNGENDYDDTRGDEGMDGISGSFVDADGEKVPSVLKYKIVDTEMVPGQERNKWSLQIDGTLLDEEEEAAIREEEKERFENMLRRKRSRSQTPGTPVMSGALSLGSRGGSIASSP